MDRPEASREASDPQMAVRDPGRARLALPESSNLIRLREATEFCGENVGSSNRPGTRPS